MDIELIIAGNVARVRLHRGARAKALRPVALRLWSEHWPVNVLLPGPSELARFVEPRQPVKVFRSGRTLLACLPEGESSPTALALVGQVESLRSSIRGLPELPSMGEAYGDLVRAAHIGGAALDEYLADVVRHFVRQQKEYREPTKRTERAPAKSARERQQAGRDRKRDEERECVEWAVAALLSEGDLKPGERIAGPELHRRLTECLHAAWDEYGRMVTTPDPVHDREFWEMTMNERREAWEGERREWELPPPRRLRLVTSRALYRVLRSPAFAWQDIRVGGVVTFVVGSIPDATE